MPCRHTLIGTILLRLTVTVVVVFIQDEGGLTHCADTVVAGVIVTLSTAASTFCVAREKHIVSSYDIIIHIRSSRLSRQDWLMGVGP